MYILYNITITITVAEDMILNVATVLCGTLLSAYDFLKSTFSNLQVVSTCVTNLR